MLIRFEISGKEFRKVNGNLTVNFRTQSNAAIKRNALVLDGNVVYAIASVILPLDIKFFVTAALSITRCHS